MPSLKKQVVSGFLAFLLSSSVGASVVAVIDSGTDTKHPNLVNQLWNNGPEAFENNYDDDLNGYADDYYGWNFADKNNVMIDWNSIDRYSEDIRKLFEVEYLLYLYNRGDNRFTSEMVDWYQNVLFPGGEYNEALGAEADFFGTYAHGTHVAGIVAQDNPNARIMTAKLLGTPAKLKGTLLGTAASVVDMVKAKISANTNKAVLYDLTEIKDQLKQIAQSDADRMGEIASYIAGEHARVANASFGTGYHMTRSWLKGVLPRIGDVQIEELASFFQNELVAANKKGLEKAPNTLFVVAAGNDSTDIDKYPDSPASVDSDNVISVAASWGRKELADFSCYGEKRVHVAAPGVGIESLAPGGNYVYMSGTSQAAPYVTRVASIIVDINPRLTPYQVKEIIMKTVDYKPWLEGKVASSGIVNPNRAYEAAKNSNSFELEDAIYIAQQDIDEVPEVQTRSMVDNPLKINIPLRRAVSKRPSSIQF